LACQGRSNFSESCAFIVSLQQNVFDKGVLKSQTTIPLGMLPACQYFLWIRLIIFQGNRI
jgi:hypothetical protein